MALNHKNMLTRFYVAFLTRIAPFYKLAFKTLCKASDQDRPKRVVLLISRTHDVELLVELYNKAQERKDLNLSFWVVDKCAKRHPKILSELNEKNIYVEMTVSFFQLIKVLNKFMWSDAFLSTVESTTARHKLPYVLTVLANAVGLSTYTMQHGFENVGLTYCDEIHGPEVKFSAKTVFTWGPTEELPAWVEKETRDKAVAVGCPKKLVFAENNPLASRGERPIIGIFDNLHWHRYDEKYTATFLNHLEEIARQRKEFRFVLKSHPDSIRNRNRELTVRLRNMENVDIADFIEDAEPTLTTPWLLSHALGAITTPSTIALDGALSSLPIAVTRYGLDLNYYTPLYLLDQLEDWHTFLNQLTEESEYCHLKLNGERFLNRVLVSGDPVTKILNLMTE